MIERFINIFKGLERAHGVTYVDKKGNGEKIFYHLIVESKKLQIKKISIETGDRKSTRLNSSHT